MTLSTRPKNWRRRKIERQIRKGRSISNQEGLIMENLRRWINYDWFKLIVALILLVLLFVLWMQTPPQSVSEISAAPTETQPSELIFAATVSPTTAPIPSAATPQPADTAVPAPTEASPATPQPTTQPTLQPTPTPTQPASSEQTASGDCSKALPTRLSVGKQARVVYNLYMRKGAGMDQAILLTNLPGATLDIVGGPVCIPYGEGVYRWWNVNTTSGSTGWSAEASLTSKIYFMAPVQ
jgi:hypothetical protein